MNGHKVVAYTVIALALIATAGAAAKPRITVASDGFPTGQDTPEGAASDLARAFIRQDEALFKGVCIRSYGAGQSRAEYIKYMAGVIADFKQKKGKGVSSPDTTTKIARVFAARHLSKNGPASYGYASFDFDDVMFVDVEVLLGNGKQLLRRTMAIKDRDGKWYVHPVPDVSPLLSSGLNDETASVQLFSDVYSNEK
jgi:hypothetical protein